MAMKLRGGRRFPVLCRDLYLLTQDFDAASGPERGWSWERRIAEALYLQGFPVRSVAGGLEVHGAVPASGLRHQIDAEIRCRDSLVIGEWKAYTAPVPKNEVLRFKAVTDDVYETMSARPPRMALMRLFGSAGDASVELRRYAARHGIALVERSRWPAAVLADSELRWPADMAPSEYDRRRLAWLCRPIQRVFRLQPDGSLRVPRPPAASAIDALLALHDWWSERLSGILENHSGAARHCAARRAA
jgi:hypothetical protein